MSEIPERDWEPPVWLPVETRTSADSVQSEGTPTRKEQDVDGLAQIEKELSDLYGLSDSGSNVISEPYVHECCERMLALVRTYRSAANGAAQDVAKASADMGGHPLAGCDSVAAPSSPTVGGVAPLSTAPNDEFPDVKPGTALPWYWHDDDTLRGSSCRDDNGWMTDRIVETDSGYYPPRSDDRAYIVAACNAYPALRKALLEAERSATDWKARAERYEAAIRWALGEEGDFAPLPEGRAPGDGKKPRIGRYYWRTELRKRAFPWETLPAASQGDRT